MRRREFIALIVCSLTISLADAQELARIGVLSLHGAEKERSGRIGVYAVVRAMESLGYKGGSNIVIHVRHADADRERLRTLADELVTARVQVIVAVGTDATEAAREATSSIPVVMAAVGDPLTAGFVRSIARPGGNITGTALLNPEVVEKLLEALKEVVPRIRTVAVLRRASTGSHDRLLARLAEVAPALAIRVLPVVVDGVDDLAGQFRQLRSSGVDALLALPNPALDDLRDKIAEAALRNGLPAVGWQQLHVEAGYLLSYGPNLAEMHARAASYVDRILKGANPAELPVEQAERFKLTLNQRTAKALGLDIPATLLARADEVIE